MSKKTLTVAIITFALGMGLGAGIVLKSCGPDKAYWVKRDAYNADVRVRDEALAVGLAVIADKDKVIAEKDKALVARETRIDDLEYQAASN